MGRPSYDVCMLVENSFRNDSRVLREARSLVGSGLDVLLLALHEPHVTEQMEETSGIRVHRVPVWSRRLRIRWMLGFKVAEFLTKLAFHALRSKANVFHAHHPATLLPAAISARLRGAKLVYDSHELAMSMPGDSPLKRRIIKVYEGLLLRFVDLVIVSDGESRARILRKTHGFNGPIEYIYNYPVYVKASKRGIDLKESLGLADSDQLVCYTGHVGSFRGLEETILSMRLWPECSHFVMVGPREKKDAEPLMRLADRISVHDRVHFWGPVPSDDVASWIGSADVAVVLVQNVGLSYYYSAPTKMFEAIMARVPQVSSNFPEIRRVVLDNPIGPVGKLVDPSDENEVGTAIAEILNNQAVREEYRRNSDTLAVKVFNWGIEERTLLSLYKELMA